MLALVTFAMAGDSVVYEPAAGPGEGRHIVFLTGDEEYRSEEGLPMLAKILSQRHGFKCTVLFALDPDGTINPDNQKSLPGAEALDSADAIVMLIRFRAWPDEQMKHFVEAYRRGVPIIALRTSTHPFQFTEGSYKDFNDFGERVLGEGWVSHWGKHKAEATRGVVEPSSKNDPILRGVDDVFGNSDVYEAYPPADATILLRGQVLSGMDADDPPADYRKQRASDGQEQGVNDPMMPVAWTRVHKNEAGKENRIFITTMGAATDLQSEGLRRLVVNAVYWGLGMKIPARAEVAYVGTYKPTMYGFKSHRKGVKPEDHALPPPAASRLELKPEDHIAIVGNALADRMQHHGWLETLIHARFPEHNLTVRNLAVTGDEVAFRHRSAGFGTPDEWLKKTGADVVFAFFGFNESFRGEPGLAGFKNELDTFLKATQAQNYSGRGPPRVVLFSPVANERHRDPNFPDPAQNNANLRLYTSAMAEVSAANGVQFIDLFSPSQSLYAQALASGESLTINGIHLSETGDRLLAPIMFRALFGEAAPQSDLSRLRAAVNDKNAMWHGRYRTVDGYNVYGGRSKLSFPSTQPGKEIDNYHVMQQEMTQRDLLTAIADQRIWAAAKGTNHTPTEGELPPITPVPTNKPGTGPGGTHVLLSGEDAISKMKLHKGLTVNLFADERQFPELVNPVQMAWDTKGRLWVAAWPNYPSRTPDSKVGDSLLVLEDTDDDGRADRRTVFLDDLNCPTGFQFHKDGVLVMQAPDLWFVRDTDGDGRADSRERILMGLDSADSHHTTNSMVLEPGGAVYLSDGVFHRTQVETPRGVVRNDDAAIYRFEPRTGIFETYIAYGFANPHGRVFDYWGNDLVTDATGNNTYFAPAFSGRIDYPHKHPELRQLWDRPARPSPGTGMLTSRHFPDSFQGNLLNLNVIGFQGIYRVKLVEDGSGLRGERQDDLIWSEDPNFRPTAVNVGPDGAIYFADWHNPIIGHMQHHLRDPSRDHTHGRIYRITHESRPLMTPPKIDGQPIAALLELLKEPENQTRELAKLELDRHDSAKVIAAVKKWIATLDQQDPAYAHHMTEALWLHQWHNVVDRELLGRMLESPEPRARAQATRVLCYWRDRVPDVMALLARRAEDEHPRVRLEAVRAASFFRSSDAVDVALAAVKHPLDYYLQYTLGETLRQLEPQWREAIRGGKPIAAGNPAGFAHLIRSISTADLLQLPRTPEIAQALLSRGDVLDAERHKLLSALADQRGTSRAAALLGTLAAAGEPAAKANVARLLPQLTPRDLKPLREKLLVLAGEDQPPAVRRHALAAVVTADETFDRVWPSAADSQSVPVDVLAAVPLVYDPFIRARAYELIAPLVTAREAQRVSPEAQRAAIAALASINRHPDRTFSALADLIEHGQEIPTAVSGLRALPRTSYSAERADALAGALLKWAQAVPAEDRTSSDYLSTVQFAEGLVTMLPPQRAGEVLEQLRALRVARFAIRAVREQMRYDTPWIVVEAGKPFEIAFENPDMMPHNLVVVRPGARERIGKAAMTMKPTELDSAGRAYVPASEDILAATKMIDSGQSETLKLTAPTMEGEYSYVCTYPEHWQVMWGRLIITKDIETYLRTMPDAPVAADAAGHAHQHAPQTSN